MNNQAKNQETETVRILIDFYEYDKTYELWDLKYDCKYPAREFKSLKAAENFCKRNGLTYEMGAYCDG